MLRITKSRSAGAAKAYFREALRIADYYRSGDVVKGHWHGRAAARLGLTGEVHQADFDKLMENRTPGGDKLTPRDKVNRVPGVDFTANAPKSVSLIYGLTGDERIVEAHRAAVQEMMRAVERDMKTRVRVGGKDEDRKTGNCVWAEFVHDVSRPVDGLPDPHLHTHAYLINVTWDEAEGRFKAAQIGDIKGEGEYYQAVYLAALARGIVSLGYEIERRGRWWDLGGMSRALIEGFSRRSSEIEAAAQASGVTRSETRGELGRRTRQRKRDELSAEDLRDVWRARLSPREAREVETVLKRARHGLNAAPQANVRELMRLVMGDSFANASAVSEKKLLRQVLERGYGAVRPAEALAALDAAGVIRGTVGGRDWITTEHAHRQEQAIVGFARSGRNRCAPLGAGGYAIQSEFLNAQQRDAIRHVWASQDRVMIVRGGAGVGKTTLMSEAVAGLQAGGHKSFVFASTIPATQVLRTDGFNAAETVQKLIASEAMQQQIGGDAVIWVDEAGLIDVETMERLFDLAGRHDWRIVLMGDEKQHAPVRRGDALRLLKDRAHLPVAEVSEIVRQRGAYKDAVQTIEGGNLKTGWAKLEAMGAVIEAQSAARVQHLAADYLSTIERQESVLVVAPTNRERLEVTEAIRWLLRHEGWIGADEHPFPFLRNLYWSTEAKSDPARYRPGQVVRFRQHVAGGFEAGRSWTVEGRSKDGAVTVRNAEGRTANLPLGNAGSFEVYADEERRFSVGDRVRVVERGETTDGHRLEKGAFHRVTGFSRDGEIILEHDRIVPASFPFLDHGYAATSVSSQGLTVGTVLVAMGAASVPAMSREQFYVSVSRGKRDVRVYVDDKDAVRDAIAHSSARPSASELIEGKIKPEMTRDQQLRAWRRRLNRTMERMARERGAELDIDAGLMREARDVALVEHHGRVRGDAAQLGD